MGAIVSRLRQVSFGVYQIDGESGKGESRGQGQGRQDWSC